MIASWIITWSCWFHEKVRKAWSRVQEQALDIHQITMLTKKEA